MRRKTLGVRPAGPARLEGWGRGWGVWPEAWLACAQLSSRLPGVTSEPAGELPPTWPSAEGTIIQAPSPSSLDSESRASSGSSHASYKIHSNLKAYLNAAYSAFSNQGPGNAGPPETLGKQRTPTLTPCGSGAAVPHPVRGEAQQPLLPPASGHWGQGCCREA